MASQLLGGLVTGLQRRDQLELVSSLGARWRWCTAPYCYPQYRPLSLGNSYPPK